MLSFFLKFLPSANEYFKDGDHPSEQGGFFAGHDLLDAVRELKLCQYIWVGVCEETYTQDVGELLENFPFFLRQC